MGFVTLIARITAESGGGGSTLVCKSGCHFVALVVGVTFNPMPLYFVLLLKEGIDASSNSDQFLVGLGLPDASNCVGNIFGIEKQVKCSGRG